MTPLRALATKPWLPDAGDQGAAWDRASMPAAWVGLIVFLVVVTVLFLLLAVAYLMRMGLGDWVPLAEPPVLWLNTLVLVLGSVALHASWTNMRRGRFRAARGAFLTGGLCAVAFLAGQFVAWRQLGALGHTVASNPANTFFFLLSALHGLHLFGGLVVWGRVAARHRHRLVADGANTGADTGFDGSIALCAAYWHFLLLVWLALFALMLADNGGIAILSPILHVH